MAGKEIGLILMLCRLLMVMICLVRTTSVLAQQEKGAKTSVKPLQESPINNLIKIVEKNFDKLTARMTALENTVSSMQFYSIRQFNQISGSLQSTNNDLGTVRKQVSQIEVDGRSQKIALSLLGRDMADLKKTSSHLLSELESSIVYVNENMEKQGDLIRAVLGDSVIISAHETRAQLSKQIEGLALRNETSETDSVNCTVDFSGLSQHIDLRFVEFKKQTHAHLIKLVNAAKTDLKNICANHQSEEYSASKERMQEIICDCKNGRKRAISVCDELRAQFQADDTANGTENSSIFEEKTTHISMFENVTNHISGSESTANHISSYENVTNHISSHENVTSSINKSENVTTQAQHDESRKFESEEDERIMNILYNMTESVLHAVSYFRNTGRLLEQIVSNTDSIVVQQNNFDRRLMIVEMGGQESSQYGENGSGNVIPGTENEEGQKTYKNSLPGSKSALGGSYVPNAALDNIASVIKNGSHLLEALTDLAQLSSVSLTKATAALQDEVKRVEGVRTLMATTILAKNNDDEPDPVSMLTNITQRTFKLVEAVASNTGWLPLIIHNVQHLESLANRSVQIVTQNQEILSQIQQTVASQGSTKDSDIDVNDPTSNNIVPHTLGQMEDLSYSDVNTSSKLEAIMNRESLKTIYQTSLQLSRIIPALTKLLVEQDPLITLVGGGKLSQGRVEIYHKNVWGTLCHTELSHLEADLICRHLGFQGGISAGAGHFGSGSGVTWIINASCFGSNLCRLAAHLQESAHCSHDQDAAVICDHMLRIVSSSVSSNLSSNVSSNATAEGSEGRLEIHHKSMWLPVCADGWTDTSARVACRQMGFSHGTHLDIVDGPGNTTSTWLGKTTCTGLETRLDACPSDGWMDSCKGLSTAGVRCL